MKEIFLKNFVIVNGYVKTLNYFPNFSKAKIDEHTFVFYQESKVLSQFHLKHGERTFEIKCDNFFYPLFHYFSNKCEIITPNYINLLRLDLPLSLNENGIREFILFNTSFQNHTFHNEVERLTGIEKIVFENSELTFRVQSKSFPEKILKDRFIEKIDVLTSVFKECFHGVFLSGGNESRINAAIAQAYRLKKEFITWGHPRDKEYLIAERIANQLKSRLQNIRLDSKQLPYDEILQKSGYLVNMQYAYRYAAVKHLFDDFEYEVVWTGWGDINGYPVRYQPSELFSAYYLGLYHGEEKYPSGWNREWLEEYNRNKNRIKERIQAEPGPHTFFELKTEVFAPAIFGAVLGIENTLGTVLAPWFSPEMYAAVRYEEKHNPKLITHKIRRVRWKNELYFQLLKKYCPELNYIRNTKGYYPWMTQAKLGIPGLFIAAIMKKLNSFKKYPFEPTEDKLFIKKELFKILDSNLEIFNKQQIEMIIKNMDSWQGPDIHENFKLIQIHWFLSKNQ